MKSKESPSNKGTNTREENRLEEILTLIGKITKDAEEKILLEDSLKNIIKGADNIVEHIKLWIKKKEKNC